MPKLLYHGLIVIVAVLLSGGCASVQRATPQAYSQVSVNLKDNDYTVLNTIKGVSTTTSYAGGIVKVVDGEKVRVLGIKFFKDQYCYFSPKTHYTPGEVALTFYLWPVMVPVMIYRHSASAEDRAYYKVLEASPDADAIINPSLVAQRSGFLLFRSEEEVTVTAKAIKYKADGQ